MTTVVYEKMLSLQEEIVANRRHLHKNPELGFDLENTLAFVESKLLEYGISYERVGKAGISCTIGSGEKCFLIRGDMDALPMAEETGLEFASTNGSMHACGHDFHTSTLLAAAKVLKEQEASLKGCVKVFFQAAEEILSGAQDAYDAGILENPKVDAAFAQHVVHESFGTAGYTPGVACGSSDVFTVDIFGVGGHGAAPHKNIDPINIMAHTIVALQTINSREINPNEGFVLTVCSAHSGTAHNIMPPTAQIQGSIRTMDLEVKEFARKRLVEVCENVAKTFQGSAEVSFLADGIPPMLNDEALCSDVAKYIDGLLGDGTCYHIERMTGSEDFSVFSTKIPCALFWFGTGSEDEGFAYGVHDSRVTFNEDALPKMAAVYVEVATKWLEENC